MICSYIISLVFVYTALIMLIMMNSYSYLFDYISIFLDTLVFMIKNF